MGSSDNRAKPNRAWQPARRCRRILARLILARRVSQSSRSYGPAREKRRASARGRLPDISSQFSFSRASHAVFSRGSRWPQCCRTGPRGEPIVVGRTVAAFCGTSVAKSRRDRRISRRSQKPGPNGGLTPSFARLCVGAHEQKDQPASGACSYDGHNIPHQFRSPGPGAKASSAAPSIRQAATLRAVRTRRPLIARRIESQRAPPRDPSGCSSARP
jgi:hypothetical protein